MYETYPKSGKRMYGEQKSTTFASASGSVSSEYQRVGSKDRYKNSSANTMDTHKSRQKLRSPYAKAGGNAQVSLNPANKGHKHLKSEGTTNQLVSPTSRPPKAR